MQLFMIKIRLKDGFYRIGARLDRTPFIHILTFGGFAAALWLAGFFIARDFSVTHVWLPSVISFSVGFGKEMIEGKLSEQGFDVLDLLGDAIGVVAAYGIILFFL